MLALRGFAVSPFRRFTSLDLGLIPVARSSFGIKGAQIPTLLRGLVGVGWCGFNIWIGADAIYNFILGLQVL